MAAPIQSVATARAVALVAARREPAEHLGRSLADLINQPDEFAAALRRGLVDLADPDRLVGHPAWSRIHALACSCRRWGCLGLR